MLYFFTVAKCRVKFQQIPPKNVNVTQHNYLIEERFSDKCTRSYLAVMVVVQKCPA